MLAGLDLFIKLIFSFSQCEGRKDRMSECTIGCQYKIDDNLFLVPLYFLDIVLRVWHPCLMVKTSFVLVCGLVLEP